MRKAFILLILAVMILVTVGLWMLFSPGKFKLVDIAGFGVIILVIAFALYAGYRRLMSAKRGEPVEDELSKKVMRKASSLSYFISIYMWLAIMYFSDRIDFETHTLIGMGILAMAVILAICWLIVNFTGIKNE